MAITKEAVRHVARLASLELSEDDIERFTSQLQRILEYFEDIQNLDLSDVPEFVHHIPRDEILREDIPGETLSQQKAVLNAPEHDGKLFKFPKVMEEDS